METVLHLVDCSKLTDRQWRAALRAMDRLNLGDVHGTVLAFAGTLADHRRFTQALRDGLAA